KDSDPDLRAATIGVALSAGLARHPELRDALEARLQDDVLPVRLTAASALWSVDQSTASRQRMLDLLKEALRNRDAMIRMQAITSLKQLLNDRRGRQQTDVLSLLLEQLRDKCARRRAHAMSVLASMHPSPPEAFDVVLAALKGNDAALHYPAMEAV